MGRKDDGGLCRKRGHIHMTGQVKSKTKLKARTCYGHLGGKLGQLLFERLVELEWFTLEEGRATVYQVTEKGRQELGKLGVPIE